MSKHRKGGTRTAYLLHFFPPDGESYYLQTQGRDPAAAHAYAARHLERRGTPDVAYVIEDQRPDTIRGIPWPTKPHDG